MGKAVLVLALLAAASVPKRAGVFAESASQLDRAIEQWLGPSTDRAWADIEYMDNHRCAALPKLVAVLHVGEFGDWSRRPDTRATIRTSNALRALRIITAHDEFGPLSRRDFATLPWRKEIPGGGAVMQPTDLNRGLKKGKSRFFAYWLSHGETYFAPATTQRAIIARWQTFLRTFNCRAPLPDSRKDPTFFDG